MKKLSTLILTTICLTLGGCASAPHKHQAPTKVIVIYDCNPTFVPTYIYWSSGIGGHPHDNRFRWRR